MAKRGSKRTGSVLGPDGARRLLESSKEDLTEDERALLLVLIGTDAEVRGKLSKQERAALDRLKEQMEGYDAGELAQAVKRMVTAEVIPGRKLAWPELKRRQRRSSGE